MFLFLLHAGIMKAEVSSRALSAGWTFRQTRSEFWYPAAVPGCVHTDLMANRIIEDPFFRLNERGVQWVDKEDWFYQTYFDITDEEQNAVNQILVFKGLDTYADVYLNGKPLLNANNMFREWRCDVKGLLKDKQNHLEVYFHSPVKIDVPKWESLPYQYSTGPDQAENGGLFDKRISIWARKAGYHYGWDWGPRLVTSGIWRPVFLEVWNTARIDNVQLIQKNVTAKKAELSTVVEILSDGNIENARVILTADGKEYAVKNIKLKPGINTVCLDYVIPCPRLWWCNGLGEPYLYKFCTTVEIEGQKADAKLENIGLRSLKLISEKDKYGKSLYFELNGHKVFMKGANLVPCDNFLPRVTDSIYEKTVADARDVNMNMLRVWGGGIYEDDAFYKYCDKYGILVWQDFMFACSTYPADSAFLENVRQEAVYNVKRLRNHPCIAVWCGNNECQDIWFGWGGKKKMYEEQGYADIIWEQFHNLFFGVLPEVVKQYAGGISYRPSSPFAFDDTPSDGINGDDHYWGVWHGREPIGNYNVKRARFFSEYGFQSFPEYESVKIYAPDKRDQYITSEVMMAHQRAGNYANKLIEEYIEKEYRKPADFESFLYVGMILQGDAIKTAIEAHRRDMPYCMGSLFWQHNDCWPVASWSSRDYYGRWKAQHYFAKNAFADILVSPLVADDTVTVHVVSDRLKNEKGTFRLKVMDLKGTQIFEQVSRLTVSANTSEKVFTGSLKKMIGNEQPGDVLLYVEFRTKDKLYRNIGYAVKQKDMNYPKARISSSVKKVDGGYEITLTSDNFARGVFMSIDGIRNFFEDNYFDILPGESRMVKVNTALTEKEFKEQLKIVSLGDYYGG
ncbi:MAG: beta-mannosidase [Coprobacter sp.]|jgi:beta-mannosidase|nr:glycoside hydrolase family 2 protein [Barnesiella sp. GGCC_0306]MBS7040383.1 glycoside hydrolase family 2 protein [Bacteroidales bacterium]PWM89342.1 MAG: beta-mannosidase [Coprobacter sp.]